MPESTFNARTARPSSAPEAATLAKRIVCVATGSGESTITSRRSGKVASQLTTVISPATNIMVEIKFCSTRHAAFKGDK